MDVASVFWICVATLIALVLILSYLDHHHRLNLKYRYRANEQDREEDA